MHPPASSEKDSPRSTHARLGQRGPGCLHDVDEAGLTERRTTSNGAIEESAGLRDADEDADAVSRIQSPDNDEEVEWVGGEIMGLESSCEITALLLPLLLNFFSLASPIDLPLTDLDVEAPYSQKIPVG